jgi:hypothetical protein
MPRRCPKGGKAGSNCADPNWLLVGVMPREAGVPPPMSCDRSVLKEPAPVFRSRYAPPLQRHEQ